MKRARIILVDDHAELLALAAGLLEPEFEVLKTFSSGKAMLEEAALWAPDLCVLDITMPGLNGIEVARRLTATGSNAKIVFLTVHEDEDYVRSALAIGALGYVVKHRMASDLIPAVHAALAGRQFISKVLQGQHL